MIAVPRGRRLALDAAMVLLAIAGVTLVVVGAAPPARQRNGAAEATVESAETQGPPGPPPPSAPAGPVAPPADPRLAPLGRSEPVHLDIPAIGVSTPLIPLGLNPDGTIAVPPLGRGAPAGWYRYLAAPGEVGPAVLLGHVDSARDGPAVFYRLIDLRAGDTVTVRRADGRTAVFTVTRIDEYEKSAFPTEAVYGTRDHPELRLVTCGGAFDKIHHQYRANVVAYATFAGVHDH